MRSSFPKIIFILLALIVAGWTMSASAAQQQSNNTAQSKSTAANRENQTNIGRISAINEKAETVVVQVPIADGQELTVGGPVVNDANLRKNGKKADLQDFQVGEKVQVTWEKTDQTLLIKGLEGR